MEKTRVKKGEDYWFIDLNFEVTLSSYGDQREPTDNWLFNSSNYFATKEEAESMAKKLCAILKGAGVIEMPSEEEISQQYELMDTLGVYHCSEDYREGYRDAIDFIKSKIVK